MGLLILLLILSLMCANCRCGPQTYFGTTKTFTELDNVDFTLDGNSLCDEACQRALSQAYLTYNQIFTKQDQDIFKQLEQEATQFEYQLMQQHYPYQQQLPASSSADEHVGDAIDPSTLYPLNKNAATGFTGVAGSGSSSSGGPTLKQLPTLFQWDFKTTTAETPGGKSANSASAGTSSQAARPPPRPAAVTKAPRVAAVRPTAQPPPVTTAAAAATTEAGEEEISTAASRIPKIYVNNPKIDPFTELPSLVPEVGGTPPTDGSAPTKKPSFKITLKFPKKDIEDENSRVKKTIEPAADATSGQLIQQLPDKGNDEEGSSLESREESSESTDVDDDSATSGRAALSSINSLAADKPKFKFSDLLEEEEVTALPTIQKVPDSFKFFPAVPGSSAS